MEVIETLLKVNDDDTVSLAVDVSVASAADNDDDDNDNTTTTTTTTIVTTNAAAAIKTAMMINANDKNTSQYESPQKEGKQQQQKQPQPHQPQKSPNSVTLLEETYRSLDVTKVLQQGNQYHRKSRRSKQNSSSRSPTKQKRRQGDKATDNSNTANGNKNSNSNTSNKMEEKNKHVVSTPTKNESDIFLDAFETMEDIAVKLFNPIMSINNDNEETTDTDNERDVEAASANGIKHSNTTDTDDDSLHGLELEHSMDIPFDEKGIVAMTPVFSNRKGGTKSTSISPSSVLDNHDDDVVVIYRQRQKKWEKLKTKAHEDYQNSTKNSATRTGPSVLNLDDCGVFADMTKPITDAVYQSQAILYDVLVGNDDIMYDNGINGSQRRGRSRNNSFSSEDSSFASDDSCDDTYDEDDEDDDDGDDHSESTASNSTGNGRKRDVYQNNDISHKREIEEAMDDYDSDYSDYDEQMDSHQVKSSVSLKQFLSDITQHGRKLRWHKPIRSSAHGTKTGIAVNISIVISDSNNGSDSVEPNLAWEVILEKKKNESKVRFQDVKSIRQRLSLFNIASVQKAADSMNLHSFPYAIPEHSILITLHDGTVYFFEAEDEAEAKLVIHGLRWISARMVFNLLAGNRNVCSEMLPLSMNGQILSSDVMQAVTNHLVDKSLKRLSERTLARRLK